MSKEGIQSIFIKRLSDTRRKRLRCASDIHHSFRRSRINLHSSLNEFHTRIQRLDFLIQIRN